MKTGRRIRRMQNLKRQIRRWFQVYEFSSVEDDPVVSLEGKDLLLFASGNSL